MKNKSFFLVLFLIFSVSFAFATDEFSYMRGFGNYFSSEALPEALPLHQNNPQQCPLGLYAEQLNGTSFTTPRVHNQTLWLYRIRPSVCHKPFVQLDSEKMTSFEKANTPNQLRWKPFAIPEKPTDFIEGLIPIAKAGEASTKEGLSIYIYLANRSMENTCFYNADGDFLIVPQLGELNIQTECGYIKLSPGEICVIPRGFRFKVNLINEAARGYICEVYNNHFVLPDLGPIGANGLANPHDFLTPVAAFEDINVEYRVVAKFNQELFEASMSFSPFNVVAFKGNYVPYKYDLRKFCPMNTVSFDHADPSIFTVLTCPSNQPGVAALDFVIFPERWNAAEHTFRPPYYHRNCMSEYMGLIFGSYEAKKVGFVPGGSSLHSCMTPHGPETNVFEKASTQELRAQKIGEGSLAFMFESTYQLYLSQEALKEEYLDTDYHLCWDGLKSHFNP